MRRADRLFEIIQLLRRKPTVRARELGQVLEVSERTIYRDIQDLMASGVPIEGEAGVGYVLKAGFDLPPLMFKERELEALVLGARMVESWGDTELAGAACDAIAKIEAVIPAVLREYMASTALLAPPSELMAPIKCDLAELRRAVRSQLCVRFHYTDILRQSSERTVRPLSLAFFGPVWLLAAWCELRDDFRTFRLDRIEKFSLTGERFRAERGKTLHDFLKRPQTWTRNALSGDDTGRSKRPPSASGAQKSG
jgi:predicted DNA-binding transcriptional regulator YafY